jgi:hypothetical protein
MRGSRHENDETAFAAKNRISGSAIKGNGESRLGTGGRRAAQPFRNSRLRKAFWSNAAQEGRTMQFIDALIEAEAQLDFGRNAGDVQRALDHLKAVNPGDDLVRALQLKLVQLRLAEALSRA